eukprot:TRINITY_DN20501_c0_g1_i1.p1 TRINITY_DN20501_c0_g1~~TRINITY_DN20501_c0_g1_i1.p1  ORF type:complete len:431 (+),score=77.54 TRINITY_DN20501_c0_g1_i1:149-1441(+)
MAASDRKTSPDKRYVRGAFIAKGAFKRVYQALDEEEGLEVAWNEASLDSVMDKEVGLLKSLRHPHVVSILESWDDKARHVRVFITELLASGSLRTYIKRISQKKLSDKVISCWGKQILDGLVYLHRNKIIHRDLKCDNIFINGHRGEVKIGDFGLSCVMSNAAGSVIGTPEFMAPEIYDEHYTEKVDIYSFGMCLLEMTTGTYPYSECENCGQVFKRVTSGMPPNSLQRLADSELKRIIVTCLKPAAERPSAVDLIQHPFFRTDGSIDDVTNTSKVIGKMEVNPPPQEKKVAQAALPQKTAEQKQSILQASEAQDIEIAQALTNYGVINKGQQQAYYAKEDDYGAPLEHIEFSPRGEAINVKEKHCDQESSGSDKLSSSASMRLERVSEKPSSGELSGGNTGGYSQKLSTLTANHVKILQKMSELISKVE